MIKFAVRIAAMQRIGRYAELMFTMHSYTAKQIATNNRIPLHADFYMLPSEIVDRILIAAQEYGYRKPKTANGSTARYFYALLCRAALRSE